MPQPAPQNRKSRIALLGLIAVLALCGFQYGDKLGLNGLPFAQVRPLVGDLSKAERMAKQGNIDFFAGQPVAGTPLTLANLPTRIASSRRKRMHTTTRFARNCAPRRVAPYFIPDQGGTAYVVLTPRNGVPVPEKLLDRIGVPGVVVKGTVLESGGIKALAILDLAR